mgnify:CR=1 FL=1
MKRCVVLVVKTIDIGMSIKKKLNALMMTSHYCKMKRCVVIHVKSIGIGMSIKEKLNALIMGIP